MIPYLFDKLIMIQFMDGPKDKTNIINYNMPYNMENDKGNDSVLIVIYDRGSFHTTQQGRGLS